jgi:hypothetical protein
MMTVRSTLIAVLLLCGAFHSVPAQRRHDATTPRRHVDGQALRREIIASWRRDIPHYGKWLTAASSVALIVFAQRQHDRSNRDWNTLLDVCRSAQDACALDSDGHYIRSDAEQLYQRSRAIDRRANRWLFGAEASLLATTALFIIDLHPGEGPDNIPYPPVRVGMQLHF